MSVFVKRADAVNAACCPKEDACSGGMPKQCPLDCAQKLVPFYDECKKLIAGNAIHRSCRESARTAH
jgi:hypothetical protein